MSFKSIDFGRVSAEAESENAPGLLLGGYLDNMGAVEEAIHGNRFLFLGYKGSGKTALAEHIKLRSASDPLLFSRIYILSDFPYSRFNTLIGGSTGTEGRLPIAWTWLLLIAMLDSFSDDQGSNLNSDSSYANAVESYRKIGLLPAKDLKELVMTSLRKRVKAQLWNLLELELETIDAKSFNEDDLRFMHLVTNLKEFCLRFKSKSNHIILIDGLDNAILGSPIQYHSISTLISEARQLNGLFRSNEIPGKFVVLCRSDLFERLPGSNKNKIKQDYSLQFNWHRKSHPADSPLVKLANLRANLSVKGIGNIFTKYIPPTIYYRNTYSYLLGFTRYTPRDFLQLMIFLQKHYVSGCLTFSQIQEALSEYSTDYFLTELRDELYGLMDRDVLEIMFRVFASLRRNSFTFAELERQKKFMAFSEKFHLTEVLKSFYECNAIGNVYEDGNGNKKYSYKFMNPNSIFVENEKIILHRALNKALNP